MRSPSPAGARPYSAPREFPGAIVGGARTFAARTPWGWVSHLQVETPYLSRGAPRRVPFVSSLCMAVPRSLPLRWDESYGGEDAIFCADALAAAPSARLRPAHASVPRPRPRDVRRAQAPAGSARVRARTVRADPAGGRPQAHLLARSASLLRAREAGLHSTGACGTTGNCVLAFSRCSRAWRWPSGRWGSPRCATSCTGPTCAPRSGGNPDETRPAGRFRRGSCGPVRSSPRRRLRLRRLGIRGRRRHRGMDAGLGGGRGVQAHARHPGLQPPVGDRLRPGSRERARRSRSTS